MSATPAIRAAAASERGCPYSGRSSAGSGSDTGVRLPGLPGQPKLRRRRARRRNLQSRQRELHDLGKDRTAQLTAEAAVDRVLNRARNHHGRLVGRREADERGGVAAVAVAALVVALGGPGDRKRVV